MARSVKEKVKKYTRYKIKHERTLTKRILEHAKQKSLKDEEDKSKKNQISCGESWCSKENRN